MDFGEIVEPDSRAFWDNYEDLEDNDVYDDPTWIWFTDSEGPEVPANKSHVVVFEGESISEFVNSAILKKRSPLCQLNSGPLNSGPSGNCVAVFDLPDSPVLVVVSQEKNLNFFSPITELLEPLIAPAQQVTTITVQPTAFHKRTEMSPDDDSICYLRSLNGTVKDVKPLEAPNMITGVAAGVSLWRQFKDLPLANNYVAYMESVVYDSCSTKPLIDLLQKLNVPCADVFKRRYKAESNLYM